MQVAHEQRVRGAKRVTLPGGLSLWALQAFEAKLLHREVMVDRTYERHGITLPPGACVFDVGANIGMYAVHLARTVPGVTVRAFEPAPPAFGALQRNLAEHVANGTAVNAGLAATTGSAVLEIDRFMSVAASMQPTVFRDAAPRRVGIAEWATAALADFERVEPNAVIGALHAGLTRRWSRPLTLLALAPVAIVLEARKRLFLRRHRCDLVTLSDELAKSGFVQVDLAKIDVEGAEEDVLAGIADADWPRFRQFVIEVHDVDGRLNRMAALLEGRGYRVTRDREDWALHELMGISTLYAVRA